MAENRIAENHMERFEETYYPPAFLNLAKHAVRAFEAGMNEMEKSMKLQIKDYFMQIADFQEKRLAGPIGEITLSFLYTSLEQGAPSFRLDCYGGEGRGCSDSYLSGSLPASWLTFGLKEFRKELEGIVQREGLCGYIRPAQLERLKLRAVRSLLYYFAGRFKYLMPYMIDEKALSKIVKEDFFVLGLGEYLDWQRPLFAILPEVDVFNSDSGTSFHFRRFPAYHYVEKVFRELTIVNARFTDCFFRNSTITGCTMNDCVFDGCEFEETDVAVTKMLGCLFLNCRIKSCAFTEVDFYTEAPEMMKEYYEAAEFYGCEITDSRMDGCCLDSCLVRDCSLKRLKISRFGTEETGFYGKDGVIWSAGEKA